MFININFNSIEATVYTIKTFFITICTYILFLKIVGIKKLEKRINNIVAVVSVAVISYISTILKFTFNSFSAIVSLIFLISILCSFVTKNKIGYSILISVISLSFNYILFFISIIISFLINLIITIDNDIINLILMMIIHISIFIKIFKIKKFKNGIAFFNKTSNEDYFDIIILNISVATLLSFIVIPYINMNSVKSLAISFIIFTIIMIITINRTLQLYYKHKLLVKELDDTKKELDNAKTEITSLEHDNLKISKRDHSLAHKQNILEYKINKLMMNSETAEEIDLKDEITDLSKEIFDNSITVKIPKTNIQEIDDVLEFMQHECKEDNIDFQVQLIGNIYHMVNEIISKEELQTLISDHVKDAIIAIKHSENINKSILVKLGKIDENYGLYIYDSGVEFRKEVIENLGKKPITTYKAEGGTGIGFMNTFETLKKYSASLIINEIGKPSKENYTKIVIIKFDGKNEFKIIK